MIGLVRGTLRRPYTAAIAAMLIVMMGGLAVTRMIVDIFPVIDIPVVMVVWNYPGLTTEDMERRVVFISERAYSTTVNGIQRIELQSIPGVGMLKVYFQPGTDIGASIAQITAVNNTILRIAPPGMQPPAVIQFNASNVTVAQLTMSSKTMSEQEIFDYSLNFIRVRLFTIPGLSTPAPFGGKQRQIIVDLDPALLVAKGFTPTDVVNALQASNVIVPAGTARIGDREYNVQLNSSPTSVERFNDLPIGVFNGTPVKIGDVAKVSDSFAVQGNVVHVNGKRASYLAILKHADASTLAVVEAAREALPEIQAAAPNGLELKIDFDQSVFVRGAVENVVREAIISSILVSMMILIFLGSWRNTLIVSVSIPLSIFAGLMGLFLTGQSINLMTLGGLALAVGLLVDNATVTIENIHRNMTLGKPLTVAILDGTSEVIQPLTVATLAICIVFFPVVMLFGVARFLFIPLAITVVLCMLASYVLSFTVVPAFARFLLAGEKHHGAPRGIFGIFDRAFERFRLGYARVLTAALGRRPFLLVCSAVVPLRQRRAGDLDRHRFLPQRRRRHHQAALPRPDRHQTGRDRKARAAGGGSHPRDHSGRRNRHDQRQCGRAEFVQSRVRVDRQRRGDGRRNPDFPEARPSSVDRLHPRHPRAAARRIPRQPDVFPDRRHGQPGAELRPVGTDRHPDPGRQFRPRLRAQSEAVAEDTADPRRRRSASGAGAELSWRCRSTSTGCAPCGSAFRNATSPTTC